MTIFKFHRHQNFCNWSRVPQPPRGKIITIGTWRPDRGVYFWLW